MNKTAIKNFAIWARNKLIADITYRAGLLGITEKESKHALPQSTAEVQFFDIGTKEPYAVQGAEISQRAKLAELIRQKAEAADHQTAFREIVEEVAYTWFNRLIAVRFMEINDYLPGHVRMLSSASPNKAEPDLVTNPFDGDLEYTPYEKDRIVQMKNDNCLDELFRMLFIKQCNALNETLPELFEKTSDYTELLLNISFTDPDGVVAHLVNDIDEADFKEAVEVIGWMYQYYNEERKNDVINIYKGAIKKADIPAATQLFTTDWVVRYMVDNSLGRYWIERNPVSKLEDKLDFFVTSKAGNMALVDEKVDLKEITFFDPCMGSGHILVYAFDVLMDIYRECGYLDRDAAVCILQDNLYGLDIDDRAYQLAYFALMMKARSYNRRVLTMGISPNVCAIQESNGILTFIQAGVTVDSSQNAVAEYLIEKYRHAKEIGSLQTVDEKDYSAFEAYLLGCEQAVPMDLFSAVQFTYTMNVMHNLVQQAKIMSRKYTVVCTNPPYLNKLESHLKDFIINEYKPYGNDLFSVFIYRNFGYCKSNGYSAFMTPFVWMFIKTYEKLREFIIKNKSITTLIQMEYSAFEEATVPICSFVLKNAKDTQDGYYFKLSDFKGGMEVQKQKVLQALADKNCGYFHETNTGNFSKIPGMPIAYGVSDKYLSAFKIGIPLKKVCVPKTGMRTGDNDRFLRQWYEVDRNKISLLCINKETAILSRAKWFPYNKGGEYRTWYGNNGLVVNWEYDGKEIKDNTKKVYPQLGDNLGWKITNEPDYFKSGITWTALTSGKNSFRYSTEGFLFDSNKGPMLVGTDDLMFPLLGLLSSKVTALFLTLINPTLSLQNGDLEKMPIIMPTQTEKICKLTQKNIEIAKRDWDTFEISWDFRKHPLCNTTPKIKEAFMQWMEFSETQFNQLRVNEQDLNHIFIDTYKLQDELTPEVEDKDITIRKADLARDIRSFISYAVGCMFGRYSLDVEGLVYAGGRWDGSKYSTFIPDQDNIIPITDEEYFADDIVGLFAAFVKKVYGEETLEENLDFIAKALGNKGNTSREIIRSYFLKGFFKDHCRIYQKRPIYWLFDSGKADGFKALIYMHRYDQDTIGKLRVDYLHRLQRIYESETIRMQEAIDNSTAAREVAAAVKRKEKLTKQLKECKEYDEKIAHLALARIAIDLDDGVKVNYEKIQTGADGEKMPVLAKF